MTSLSIIGVGRVGGEIAFLAAATGIVDTLNLHDVYAPLLHAQILDLKHTGLDITITTDTKGIKDADILVFAAGTPRNPNIRTRADLLDANIPVVEACCKNLAGFEGVVITVTNPMDANNYALCHKSGLERERCIGFGGQLDCARFGYVLTERGISGAPWVLGEHGEYQVPLFSRLDTEVSADHRESILKELQSASMGVIKGKGGTVFGPAYHITHLIRTILEDKREVLPCSCVLQGEYEMEGLSIGVPAKIGREGILEILECKMDPWEAGRFREAGDYLHQICRRAYEK